MSGYLIDMSASVMCMHGGRAQAVTSSPRVKIGGQPIVTQAGSYTVSGCAFVPPAGNGPCVTAQWIMGAMRVKAGGTPVLLQDSQSMCAPTGTGLNVKVTQVRVKGK